MKIVQLEMEIQRILDFVLLNHNLNAIKIEFDRLLT